jgi:hypothetical protein
LCRSQGVRGHLPDCRQSVRPPDQDPSPHPLRRPVSKQRSCMIRPAAVSWDSPCVPGDGGQARSFLGNAPVGVSAGPTGLASLPGPDRILGRLPETARGRSSENRRPMRGHR